MSLTAGTPVTLKTEHTGIPREFGDDPIARIQRGVLLPVGTPGVIRGLSERLTPLPADYVHDPSQPMPVQPVLPDWWMVDFSYGGVEYCDVIHESHLEVATSPAG